MGAGILCTTAVIVTGSTVLGLLTSTGLIFLGAFLGFLPLWAAFLSILLSVGYLFFDGGVFNEQRKGLTVAVLIGVMMAIVVGVNLIPAITGSIAEVTEEATGEATAVTALVGVLPYIFVAVIIIGAVAWLGGSWGGSEEDKSERKGKVKAFFGNAKEVIIRIEEASSNWEQFINNLDELLGIQTVEARSKNEKPISTLEGLYLTSDGELQIDSKNFDWYIADKHPSRTTFKVVGLHKSNAILNKVYLLGTTELERVPFLTEVPAEQYLELSCQQCLDWSESRQLESAVV